MRRFLLSVALAAAITFVGPVVGKAFSRDLPRFHYGSLKCAVNVNAWLRLHGRRGTGSASSRSFLRYPRVAAPRFGDVRFNWRRGGGHVAIVVGRGLCLNPSQNRGWRKVRCANIWRGRNAIYVRPH